MDVAPRGLIVRDFAKELERRMVERGWNQSELARRATHYMPGNRKFGRDNVSNYIAGKTLPGPVHLKALADALGCDPNELVQGRRPPGLKENPPFEMTALGEEHVWLRVNQRVPLPIALKVAAMIGGVEG